MRIKQLKYVKWGLLVLLGGFSLSAYAHMHNMTITFDNQSNCIVSIQDFKGTYGNFWGSTNEDAPVTLKEKGQKVPIQLTHTGGTGEGTFTIVVRNKQSSAVVCTEDFKAAYGVKFFEMPGVSRTGKGKGCGNYLTGLGIGTAGDHDFTLVYHPNKACD